MTTSFLLLIFAEVLDVGFHKLPGPIGDRLQPAGKEAEGLRLPYEAQTADEMPVIVQPLDPVNDIFCLGQGKDSSGESQTDHFHGSDALTAVGIPFFGKGTTLHAPDATA